MAAVTEILSRIRPDDPSAAEEVLPLVYEELRKLAYLRLAQEKPGQTLQATALVHEAYLRLVSSDTEQNWDSRGHFFAAAAEAMRRILVENARKKQTVKAGGEFRRIDLCDRPAPERTAAVDLIALDESLAVLEAKDPEKAQLVKLRFFAGLSLEESAKAMGVSRATANRHWVYARAWLYGKMNDSSSDSRKNERISRNL